jgi:hypothetical protein
VGGVAHPSRAASDGCGGRRIAKVNRYAELIIFLENRYRVTFDSDELIPDNLDTIDAISRLLERKGVKASIPSKD